MLAPSRLFSAIFVCVLTPSLSYTKSIYWRFVVSPIHLHIMQSALFTYNTSTVQHINTTSAFTKSQNHWKLLLSCFSFCLRFCCFCFVFVSLSCICVEFRFSARSRLFSILGCVLFSVFYSCCCCCLRFSTYINEVWRFFLVDVSAYFAFCISLHRLATKLRNIEKMIRNWEKNRRIVDKWFLLLLYSDCCLRETRKCKNFRTRAKKKHQSIVERFFE